MLLRPLPRMGWREGGGMRGEREKSRLTNEVARTIIIMRRYRWPNGLCLASRPEARPI
jgi:Trm5-related predicted tRNA methylase